MNPKHKYIRNHLSEPFPPRKVRENYFKEMGLPLEPNEKLKEEIVFEIQCAMATLTAIFDHTHPDHHKYKSLELYGWDYNDWSYIEDYLFYLTDRVINNNTIYIQFSENDEK